MNDIPFLCPPNSQFQRQKLNHLARAPSNDYNSDHDKVLVVLSPTFSNPLLNQDSSRAVFSTVQNKWKASCQFWSTSHSWAIRGHRITLTKTDFSDCHLGGAEILSGSMQFWALMSGRRPPTLLQEQGAVGLLSLHTPQLLILSSLLTQTQHQTGVTELRQTIRSD